MNPAPETRLAIVTGASRGIGYAVATELGRRGYRLALLARRKPPLEEAAQRLASSGAVVDTYPCDVQDAAQVRATFKQILDRAGRVDVLVNNAGVGTFAPVHQISDADWDSTLNTNLRGVFYCSKAVIPRMIEQRLGHIINISSLAGKNPLPGGSAYCASKWGLMGLTYSMAEDLREYGIRVSVVCPGSVQTEFTPHRGKDAARMLQPTDVARVVGWLLEQEPQSFVSEVLLRPTQKP
ncbi:MAG: SDR family NAD(P)-dependent oxidoreductase [Acidobacteria bacterium]|nr:SDR family NAD(P)-dependent oxidoreductase [Acidobacteriota bacterium]